MVASSRSSLRRPNLRGDHTAAEPDSAGPNDIESKQLRDGTRAKRMRIASASGREQLQKRRRVAPKPDPDEISIPLRGKGVAAEAVLPGTLTRPIPTVNPIVTHNTGSNSDSPLQSPTPRPQYDQIKRIEEKARAAIRGGGGPDNASKDDRRKLRSEHGGTRSKTELAQYFPAFEEMLSLEPSDPDVLSARTRVILIDDTPTFRPSPGRADPFGANKPLRDITYVDLGSLLPLHAAAEDPLGPELYFKAHRKAERHEKQMKNGDKERAQHEKYQLERLLDELRGPDWLKTLGITGITDTEKKRYEPKRALFIRETRALIDKFKRWKEEEKRRKVEKEQAMLEETADADEADNEVNTEPSVTSTNKKSRRQANGRVLTRSPSVTSSDKGPDSSEIDALASQQLLQEAKSASSVRRKRISGLEVPVVAPEVHKPFTSFFDKRHIRDAAVAGRQRGRTILAFGEPVNDLAEDDFDLPESILTEDAIRASQRNRRRVKRSVDE